MDPVRPAVLGTLAWSLALLALLLLDPDPAQRWWTWTAAAGVVLGGLGVLAARRARRQLVRAGSAPDSDPDSDPGSDASAGRGSVSSS